MSAKQQVFWKEECSQDTKEILFKECLQAVPLLQHSNKKLREGLGDKDDVEGPQEVTRVAQEEARADHVSLVFP